ncbi:MAG: hypothetical protein AB7I27_02900 [Bacteriovoracaceae bacterium]
MNKNIFFSILFTFGLNQGAKADGVNIPTEFLPIFSITSAPTSVDLECHLGIDAKRCAMALTGSSIQIAISVALFKEAMEAKPDALNYASGEAASPALASLVEKIQAASLEQGKELSFDQVVEALVQI